MDFASQAEEQTEAVFNLVACPFALFSHVWHRACAKLADSYAKSQIVIRRSDFWMHTLFLFRCGKVVVSGKDKDVIHLNKSTCLIQSYNL